MAATVKQEKVAALLCGFTTTLGALCNIRAAEAEGIMFTCLPVKGLLMWVCRSTS